MAQELTIYQEIEKLEPKMLKVLVDPIAVKREISFAKQLIASSAILQKCTVDSVLVSVFNIVNIGLSLNPASKESFLVPRFNRAKNVWEASLQPGYVGLVKLLTDAGTVVKVTTQVVYENDRIDMDIATGEVSHKPCLVKKNRGEKIGCYSQAVLPSGLKQAEWMEFEEIYKIRECSESWKNTEKRSSSPWFNHEDEMSRKTVIRRLYKYLPRSGKNLEKVNEAIRFDDGQYQSSLNQVSYIESLLRTANISEEVRNKMYAEVEGYSQAEAETAIGFLMDNQIEARPEKQFLERAKN